MKGQQGRLRDLSDAIALTIRETIKEYQDLLASHISAHQREMEDLNRQLEAATVIDNLTGLFTARVSQEYLAREVRRADRYGHPVSLVAIDIDDFERLTTLCGSVASDEVLRALAEVVSAQVRDIDLVCRLGADEFAVILPETPVAGAMLVSERMRAATSTRGEFAADAHASGPVRISVGVAGFPEDASTAEELLSRARTALHHAKGLGKNIVVAYSETGR